jgi:hypothetical protein
LRSSEEQEGYSLIFDLEGPFSGLFEEDSCLVDVEEYIRGKMLSGLGTDSFDSFT